MPLYDSRIKLAPAIGVEPITKWLTATYSTIELLRSKVGKVNEFYIVKSSFGSRERVGEGWDFVGIFSFLAFLCVGGFAMVMALLGSGAVIYDWI